jgi:Vault protein inter-alpha-trypsin domain/von Willebrand factor type A domain
MNYPYNGRPLCGCWYLVQHSFQLEKKYLPQVDLTSSTQILATTSRTTLIQTFVNPSRTDKLDEVQYTFPLYDGVSVVGFQCKVASRTIVGVVKEKHQARADYKEAVNRGETAGLLEQLPEASDVFTTKIGNVPANEKIVVEIVYLGELKHDAETDGSRFTIPTFIAPRYGSMSADSLDSFRNQASDKGGIRILIDVVQEEGSVIRGLQSPSHPIAVTMGRTSSMNEEAFDNNHASATLTLGSTELGKDFIIIILAKGQDTPRALLETHSSIPDQRAIMTTLVPKFSLPNEHPEIVFIVDRSGSMVGKIETLVSAMKIFLKSLPVGVKFNICSFGSQFDFLFPKSKTYDQTSMKEALNHLDTFSANYGGTEMLRPIKATVTNRFKDMPLEVMLITDGEIWNQQELFDFINKSAKDDSVRFFSLGIGSGASSSLVEGIARAGDGFAQFVGDNEKMDKRVVRMLKGALTPHIKDYSLEIKYEKEEDAMDDDFEIIESATQSLKVVVTDLKKPSPKKKVISLFSKYAKEEPTNPPAGRYDHLPVVATPKILQAPHKIPPLYPFNRTTVYLLISEEACRKNPKAVILRATSAHGPLELEIPIQYIGHGQSIHQLAAKKAIHELEQGRGWITEAKSDNDKLLSSQFEGRWDEIVEREAVRLGVQFQVGGKWCSFVAVEKNSQEPGQDKEDETGWEIQEGSENANTEAVRLGGGVGFGGSAFASKSRKMSPFPSSARGHAMFGASFGRSASPASMPQLQYAAPGCAPPSPPLPLFGSAPPPHPDMRQSSTSMSERAIAPQSQARQLSQRVIAPQSQARQLSQATFGQKGKAKKMIHAGIATRTVFGAVKESESRLERRCRAPAGRSEESEEDLDGGLYGNASPPGAIVRYDAILSSEGIVEPTSKHSSAMSEQEKMHELILLQNFDGSWDLGAALFAILGVKKETLAAVFTEEFKAKLAGVMSEKVQATIAAIVFLEVRVRGEKEVWEMVVEKARAWVEGQVGNGFEDETGDVKKLLSASG